MKQKKILTEEELNDAVDLLIERDRITAESIVYGIPRGGVYVADMIKAKVGCTVTSKADHATHIVDDLIDSGATMQKYSMYGGVKCALFDRSQSWLVFPWEIDGAVDTSAFDIVTRMLQRIGEDVGRDGLKDTPKRVVKSWEELYAGYSMNPDEILGRTFDNEESYNQMIVLKDIEFFSMCEHHLMPFFGKVHIAYIPNSESGHVVGISKLARLVDCFSRRLQIQERMTKQILNAIVDALDPHGVAVFVEAQHTCMIARGVRKQNSIMVTSALHGAFEQESTRLEFLLLQK